MKRTFGIGCMVLGAMLLFGALGLFLHNQSEAESAGEAADKVLEELQEAVNLHTTGDVRFTEPTVIAEPTVIVKPTAIAEPVFPEAPEPTPIAEMTEIEINGYAYIGYISIPTLNLELPVMSDWDLKRLQIAPCRQFGSTEGNDLVIAAHNFRRHFGRIKKLMYGDEVSFTDMDGETTLYLVQKTDILQPSDVEAVENSTYDLILYTCTYGGKTRVAVGCNKK